MDAKHIRWLGRRYGFSCVPMIACNALILWAIFYTLIKFGAKGLHHLDGNFLVIAVMFNVIPLLILCDVWIYRLGWSEDAVFARPLFKFGPCREMQFDAINVVDLKALSDFVNSSSNAKFNPSVIVLYRTGWDGEEIFALDPRRTNLRQFKDLLRRIHDRCPESFTENALRYLNGSNLITPREGGDGSFIW